MGGGLKTLIRLNEWSVDQKRRALGDVLRLIDSLENQGRDLERELLSEQAAAKASPDEAGYLYGHYANAVIARRERIEQSVARAEMVAEEAREELNQAYRELKKYQTAQAARELRQLAERDRKDQAVLDEIGMKSHLRKNQ